MAYTRKRSRGRVNLNIDDELWRALMYKANILGYRSRIENEIARENEADAADRQFAESQTQLQNAGLLSRQKQSDDAAMSRDIATRAAADAREQAIKEGVVVAASNAGNIGQSLLRGNGGVPWNTNAIYSFVNSTPDIERSLNFAAKIPHIKGLTDSGAAAQEAQNVLSKRRADIEFANAQEMADAAVAEAQSKSIHNVGSSALIPSKFSGKYDAITGAQTGTKDVFADIGGLKMKVGEESTQFPPSITKLSGGGQSWRPLQGVRGPTSNSGGIPELIARPTESPSIPATTPSGKTPPAVSPAKEAGAQTEQDFQGIIPMAGQAVSNAIGPVGQNVEGAVKGVGQAGSSTWQNIKTLFGGGKWATEGYDKVLGLLSKAGSSNMPFATNPPQSNPNPLQQTPPRISPDIARQIQAQKLINSWSQLSPEQQDNGMLQEEKANQEQFLYSKPRRNTEDMFRPSYGLEYEDEENYRRSPFNFLNY